MMFKIISLKKFKNIIRKHYDNGYNEGIARGYSLGYLLGQIESRNRSFSGIEFVKKSKLDYEIENILKEF